MDNRLLLIGLGLAAIAALAVILRQRLQSRRELVRQVRELTLLAEAGRAIAEANLDVDELCELIFRRAADMVDVSTFQIGLFDGDWYDIRLWQRDGVRMPPQRFDLRDNAGLIGWTRTSRTPLLVRDFEAEFAQLPARPRYLSDRPPRSGVFVPLVAGSF
jgi:hypothetical protein